MRCVSYLVTLLLLGCMSPTVADQAGDGAREPLWEFQVVAFGQNFPAYPSSADQNLTLLPLPFPVYRGKFLRFGEDLDELASGQIVDTDRIKLSLGISASFPEDSDSLALRSGMPDLDFLVEAGPEIKFRLRGNERDARELNLSLQLRAAISVDGLDGKGRGVVFNPEIEYLARDLLGEGNEVKLRLSSTWASDDFMNYFYGVAPQFATTDRPTFNATSGYLNTELLVGLRRKLSDRLEFRGSVRLWVNKGSTNSSSPLYQRDYDKGIRLALFWTAWQSKRR
ncbi:MAG TPA: MipA/OmpV family protein [Woeseiaceae bacterium]|nr:MipA/OmpV family protein [Woeseiaceae bacterium]